MEFSPLGLPGAYLIAADINEDERGCFARIYCQKEFEVRGIGRQWVQVSASFNRRKGTIRGMHYQVWPFEEAKLVRCARGAVYDVLLDLRPGSPTYTHWVSTRITAENSRSVYIPEGIAHGYQTLEDNTEVFYQISQFHEPQYARGVRWDDPRFGIQWPLTDPVISEKDRNHADWR